MTKCDDKSGYDHVLLSACSQTYVGFEWKGYWFVCGTLPFGWKISPYIYHTIGLAASSFLRAQGVPCSLYIDDVLMVNSSPHQGHGQSSRHVDRSNLDVTQRLPQYFVSYQSSFI